VEAEEKPVSRAWLILSAVLMGCAWYDISGLGFGYVMVGLWVEPRPARRGGRDGHCRNYRPVGRDIAGRGQIRDVKNILYTGNRHPSPTVSSGGV